MTPSDEVAIREVDAERLAARRDGVLALLGEAVEGNVSLGFLRPLDGTGSEAWFDGCVAEVRAGSRHVWVAERAGDVIGVVHLELALKENARHRGEVQKLVVAGGARRLGIGGLLMGALEDRARALGRFLLILDTDEGSGAVTFYDRLGWQSAGVVPDYARRPDGMLWGTRLFWRDLRRTGDG